MPVRYYGLNSQKRMPSKLYFMSFQITQNFVVMLKEKKKKTVKDNKRLLLKKMICYNVNKENTWYSSSY